MRSDLLKMILTRARRFWRVCSEVLPEKETSLPELGAALEFDKLTANGLVLDYGCGGGSDALSYLRRKQRVVAVDVCPANVASAGLRISEDKHAERWKGRWATWLLEDSERIEPFALGGNDGGERSLDGDELDVFTGGDTGIDPLPMKTDECVGAFDIVNAFGVLHHIPAPTVERVVRAFHTVIKPGGRLYATFYTPEVEREYAGKVVELVRAHRLTHEEALGWCADGEGCPWTEIYETRHATELLTNAGFKVTGTYVFRNDWLRTFRCERK